MRDSRWKNGGRARYHTSGAYCPLRAMMPSPPFTRLGPAPVAIIPAGPIASAAQALKPFMDIGSPSRKWGPAQVVTLQVEHIAGRRQPPEWRSLKPVPARVGITSAGRTAWRMERPPVMRSRRTGVVRAGIRPVAHTAWRIELRDVRGRQTLTCTRRHTHSAQYSLLRVHAQPGWQRIPEGSPRQQKDGQ